MAVGVTPQREEGRPWRRQRRNAAGQLGLWQDASLVSGGMIVNGNASGAALAPPPPPRLLNGIGHSRGEAPALKQGAHGLIVPRFFPRIFPCIGVSGVANFPKSLSGGPP